MGIYTFLCKNKDCRCINQPFTVQIPQAEFKGTSVCDCCGQETKHRQYARPQLVLKAGRRLLPGSNPDKPEYVADRE